MKARFWNGAYWNGALAFLVAAVYVVADDDAAQNLDSEFDKKPGEPGYIDFSAEVEPILERDDYIELVKAAHPPVKKEWQFYELFIQIRDHYQKEVPSVFENPSWPLYIAVLAEQRLIKVRVAESARKTRKQKQWVLTNSALSTASLGKGSGRYVNRDPRSVANDNYVGSTHKIVPLRSNALGSAYQWKDGKWTFSGRGWKRVNKKWVKDETSSGLQGAKGLGKK